MSKCPAASRVEFIPPLLPTLVDQPPEGKGWIHEVKFDGYRSQIVLEHGRARVFTRRGHDWTDKYGLIAEASVKLRADTAIIDGEIIVTNDDGITDFSALRSAIVNSPGRLVFVAFDLLHLNDHDLRQMTLQERRHMLLDIVEPAEGPIQFSHELDAAAKVVFRAVEKIGLEGMVSKRVDSRYRSGQSRDWLKAKCYEETDYEILGVQRARGKPTMALVAERNGKRQYAGSAFVAVNRDFRERLWERVRKKAGPAPKEIPLDKTGVEWVKPGLVGRVRHMRGEETLRHATLKDVREDD